jgi:hypothetical protein
MANDWGKIMVGTRLEKMVESDFVEDWTRLIRGGLRTGDQPCLISGKTAHMASNALAANLLHSECDTVAFIDSDAGFDPDVLNVLRDYQPGWEYDLLQPFHTRRGWPPSAIWFKRSPLGDLYELAPYDPDMIQEVSLIGTHFVLIRRQVFEKLLGDGDPLKHHWFYYPRDSEATEDCAFAEDAVKAGFRLAATTHVKVDHISRVRIGWETYHDFLSATNMDDFQRSYDKVSKMIAAFTGESAEMVQAKAMKGGTILKEWQEGKTPTEARQYYGDDDSGYFYDLLAWNYNKYYQEIVMPLADVEKKRVLVIGAGIGGEVDKLIGHGNKLDAFELPGALKEFCQMRFGSTQVHWLDGETVMESNLSQYDLVVMIDVAEHIHPDEFGDTIDCIINHVAAGGVLYMHNSWDTVQGLYPMHYDNSAVFAESVKYYGLRQDGKYIWRK